MNTFDKTKFLFSLSHRRSSTVSQFRNWKSNFNTNSVVHDRSSTEEGCQIYAYQIRYSLIYGERKKTKKVPTNSFIVCHFYLSPHAQFSGDSVNAPRFGEH